MLIRDLMSAPAVTAPPALPLPVAAHLMRSRGIRRLPVLDGTRLIGIVTDRDLREALPVRVRPSALWETARRLTATRVSDVMRRHVLTTTEDADARDAAYTMLFHRVGGLPVLNAAGDLSGIVTLADVLHDYARPAAPEATL